MTEGMVPMAAKNGFFQLDNREDGTYIIIFPPKDGGKQVSVTEMTNYLDSRIPGNVDISA